MSEQLGYYYAEIDPSTNTCIGFVEGSHLVEDLSDNWVRVPVDDPEYIGKYYINGAWYEDAAGTIPWTSSLL